MGLSKRTQFDAVSLRCCMTKVCVAVAAFGAISLVPVDALAQCGGDVDCERSPMPFGIPDSTTEVSPFAVDFGGDGESCFTTSGRILGAVVDQSIAGDIFLQELILFTDAPSIEVVTGGKQTASQLRGTAMYAGGTSCIASTDIGITDAFAVTDKVIGVLDIGGLSEFPPSPGTFPPGVLPEYCAGIAGCTEGGDRFFTLCVQLTDDSIHCILGGIEQVIQIPNPIVVAPDSFTNGPLSGVLAFDSANAYVIFVGTTVVPLGGTYISHVPAAGGVNVTHTNGTQFISLVPEANVIPFASCCLPMTPCAPPSSIAMNIAPCVDSDAAAAGWPTRGVRCVAPVAPCETPGCQPGKCTCDSDCDDGDPCTKDTCSAVGSNCAGDCAITPVPYGAPGDCDDGLFCNGYEFCKGGSCDIGPSPCPATCDEENRNCGAPIENCGAPDPPVAGPNTYQRSLEVILPASSAGQETAYRVTLGTLYNPGDPQPVNQPNFSGQEGTVRYLNLIRNEDGDPVTECLSSAAFNTTYPCAAVGCEPEFADWGTLFGGQTVYLMGNAIVPDSSYTIAHLASSCATGDPATCTSASDDVPFTTARYGDSQPDGVDTVTDIVNTVDVVKQSFGSLLEYHVYVRNSDPAPQNEAANVTDIVLHVDALKLVAYPLNIAACP